MLTEYKQVLTGGQRSTTGDAVRNLGDSQLLSKLVALETSLNEKDENFCAANQIISSLKEDLSRLVKRL